MDVICVVVAILGEVVLLEEKDGTRRFAAPETEEPVYNWVGATRHVMQWAEGDSVRHDGHTWEPALFPKTTYGKVVSEWTTKGRVLVPNGFLVKEHALSAPHIPHKEPVAGIQDHGIFFPMSLIQKGARLRAEPTDETCIDHEYEELPLVHVTASDGCSALALWYHEGNIVHAQEETCKVWEVSCQYTLDPYIIVG